jgi:CheY-like chemotaxis protein
MNEKDSFQILVVDDDSSFRNIISDFITLYCQDNLIPTPKIIKACNGSEAFIKIKNQHFDLIITDLDMPKKDGKTLVADLFQLNKSTPLRNVIVLSGSLDIQVVNYFFKYGISHILVKPIVHSKFKEKMDFFLNPKS